MVRVTAPPVDGEANAAVIALLARLLDTAKSNVTVRRGATGRNKIVDIAGVDAKDAAERLARKDSK